MNINDMSKLTDSRLRTLDTDNLDSATRVELLESLNIELNFIKNTLRDLRITNSDTHLAVMLENLMHSDCGEEDNHFTRSREL
ncbi:MAG: hypothetical protein DRN27_10015 [Thermoplasmata archaeon]|nr:MAG: hypothetical protein DRN27_10015 [Thermoplasmata archaeon]